LGTITSARSFPRISDMSRSKSLLLSSSISASARRTSTNSPAVDAPRTLFGVPVYVSAQLATNESQGTAADASSIYVYAAGEVVLVRRADAEIELDRSRLFDRDMSEMRGKLRADVIVPNPSAVVRIAGVTP